MKLKCGRGSFAAGGRRVTFPTMGKSPKDRRGTAQDGHCVSIFALPPVPRYGGYPLGQAENFRRAKSGVLECNSFRPHWGPEPAKFRTFAVQDLRLALPNQRSRCVSSVGAHSVRPRAGLGPAPTKKDIFYYIRRRGGPRGRPCRILNQVSLPFVGAAISRPSLPPRRKAKR